MFYTYQIILWFIFLLFISSKIKKKNRRILFSVVASFFSTLEIVAVYMTEKFIDYRFYNHMNLNAIEGHGFQFISQFISFVGLFILLSFAFYFISQKMNTSALRHNKFFLPIILVLFILLSLPNGIFSETYKIYEILGAEEKDFNQALADVGISPDKYVTPDQLTAKKGKNIIVISIESLEQGFLGQNFKNITPNLSKLSTEWTFYRHMTQIPGADNTAASLYTYQVGIPAFFKGQLNSFFQGTTDVKLTGLGHILKEAGYNSKYIVGNAEFAGMSDILTVYGIPVVSQDNSLGKYPKVRYGFNDYDLFKEAKLQIDVFKRDKDKPFALFLSTINTHFPNGIYDKRMEKFISKKENILEFSLSAVDYLIKDFIHYLETKNLLKNTAIYIFPDHQFMGITGPTIEKLRKSTRQLYLLTNVKTEKLPKNPLDKLYQIDLPRMITDGAEIQTNAKFLTDYIKSEDIDEFLENNIIKLTTLNSASVVRKSYQNGIDIQIKDNNLSITSNEDSINLSLFDENEIFDITFNTEMVVVRKGKTNLKSAFLLHSDDKQYKRLHLIVNIKNGKIDTTYLGNKKIVGIYKKGDTVTYSTEDVHLIMESNNATLAVVKPTKKIQYDSSLVLITSSDFISSKTIKSSIKVGKKSFELSRGLNLLTLNHKGDFSVEHFDTYGSQEAANKFLIKIESLIKNQEFWAVASHNAIKSDYPDFKEKLDKLNFKLLQTLNGKMAYIAYQDSKNIIQEHMSRRSISYMIPSYIKPLSKEEN